MATREKNKSFHDRAHTRRKIAERDCNDKLIHLADEKCRELEYIMEGKASVDEERELQCDLEKLNLQERFDTWLVLFIGG